jgi:hypothetical protein
VPSLVGDDQSYSLDFSPVADTLKAMQLQGNYASFSSISIGSTAGEKDAVTIIRPSRMLRGEVHKPWLKEKDWRVRASWWITFVRTSDCISWFLFILLGDRLDGDFNLEADYCFHFANLCQRSLLK